MQSLIVTFDHSPTSLDVYLAAHILLLADPPFPDAVLQIQLTEHFQGLIDHARRIQAEVARAPPYEHFTTSGTLLSSLVPRLFNGNRAPTKVDPADIQYRRRTWVFAAGTLAMTVACICMQVVFVAGLAEKLENSEDNNEDGGEGGGRSKGEEEEELASEPGAFTNEEEE